MRLELNLSKYYEGLDQSQVNTLFGLFINVKSLINLCKACEKIIKEENPKEDDAIINIYGRRRRSLKSSINDINNFMESLGKGKIFDGIDENMDIDEIDFESIIAKYEHLMEKTNECFD